MQGIRKSLIWLMTALLVCSLVPAGLVPRTLAATAATYFIPDNMQIRNSALLTLDGVGGAMIDRSNVYLTTSPTLTITGTFAYVSENSMQVQVQQLTFQNNKWVPVPNQVVSGTVIRESGTTNRFIASNLTLFPGFNMITFKGMQGNVERSDTFYVLYDRVPYIENLKILGGGPGEINLNEGSQAVVTNQNITLQGQVQNATKVTVSLNGGTEVTTSLLENGMFFSPALVLRPGLNTLVIKVSNVSDSIQVQRSLYFFKADEPFTRLLLTIEETGNTYDVFNASPVVTDDTGANGRLTAQILLPYSTTPFEGNATFSIDNGAPVTITAGDVTENIVIPGPDGVTPAYRLVTFKTSQTFPLTSGSVNQVTLTVTYDSFAASKTARFSFLPGRTVIQNMYWLPDFNETSNKDVTKQTKTPLNGVQLESPDFYVLVKADREPTTPLRGFYLPLGTTALNITDVTGSATGLAADKTEKVYKITGLLNGQHQIRFYYEGSSDAPYTVNLSYISKNYIYIANLYDGQVYEFDSRQTHTLKIEGEYIGFENLSNWQYFVNGLVLDPADPDNGPDPDLDLDPANGDFKFDLELNIRPEGPLVYGENRLVFTGTTYDGTGHQREIRKELRIYIIDTNVSTISRFHPVIVPRDTRTPLPTFPFDESAVEDVFRLTPEFAINNGRYVTSEKAYDLVIRGSGATILNLKFGSETFLYLPIPEAPAAGDYPYEVNKSFTYNGQTYYYDFSGSQNDFILRVQNIQFETPGTHVYYLELINGTGARSTQRLEIVRELSAYRLLAPQPTVGDQIIVNKNFVRFDIEAEGATSVLIDGKEATKRIDAENRFYYDYSGLKPDKWNDIKIEIVRADTTIKDTVRVYYTSVVKIDSQYMEPLKTKHSVFNKKLELSFPRGTILMSAIPNSNGVYKYYTGTQLLFGIADPKDGVVERRNDYGHVINTGSSPIQIPDYLVARFNSTVNTANFTRISDIYWISGGVGEYGDRGTAGYKPATNGLPPYSLEGNFASSDFEPERKVVPSNRGTLTIAFDEHVVDDIAHTITVFRYTDRGYWENIGGEVDVKKNTITVPFDEFGYYMVAKLKRSYNDITNHPWARNVLNGLYAKGIMSNLRYDEFGADDRTTRGEFVTLLVKGLNLPLNYDDNNTFYDILPGTRTTTWSYEYIETAARAGIVQGKSEGFFGAELPITREEAAVMIARALELKLPANNDKLAASLAKSFLDASQIDYYARPAVEAVNKAKIMTGSPVSIPGSNKPGYNFSPKSNLTRAEAGAIVVRMLQKSTNIFPKTLT